MARLLADWRQSHQRMKLVTEGFPRMIGMESKKIVIQNFELQGYDNGTTFKAWASREPATDRRYDKRNGVKGSVYSSSNKILHQTGDLEDSIDYAVEGTTVGSSMHIVVIIGSNLALIPYAQIHNEGGNGMAWGKVPFKMPQRQYMPRPGDPPNRKMMKAYQEKVKYETAQAMKTFAK